MSDPTGYVAVVDRFEGDEAVLLLERDTEVVGDLVVPREALPPDARTQDAVLRVEIDDGALLDVQYDHEETEQRRDRAQSRFDRLAERPPDGDTTDTDDPDPKSREEYDGSGDHETNGENRDDGWQWNDDR